MTNMSHAAVAEIVTYRLNAGVDEAAFMDLIDRSHDFASSCSGFIARHVSKGEDGRWMDHVLWASMEEAQAAAKAFPEQDFSPEFGEALEGPSIEVRHEHVVWQSE